MTVRTPVEGYTGDVAGVVFDKGVAEVDALTPAQRRYFTAQGYGIDTPAEHREDPEPADPRLVGDDGSGHVPVGTRLRDAAVDPRPGDYLPPTNAGEANPHGPLVVAPEIHGSQGIRPVRGGRVPAADAQEDAEAGHAAAHTGVDAGVEPGPVQRPNVRDGKAAWVTWAIAQGADEDEAAASTKDALIDTYGKEA